MVQIFRKSKRIDEYADRQLKRLLGAMEALRKGDLTIRLEKEKTDIYGELADSYNTMVEQLSVFAAEVTR